MAEEMNLSNFLQIFKVRPYGLPRKIMELVFLALLTVSMLSAIWFPIFSYTFSSVWVQATHVSCPSSRRRSFGEVVSSSPFLDFYTDGAVCPVSIMVRKTLRFFESDSSQGNIVGSRLGILVSIYWQHYRIITTR